MTSPPNLPTPPRRIRPRLKPANRPEARTPVNAPDDPRTAWLRDHCAPLRSIDPLDDDFSELKPLAERIGDARIVLLGEQSHGDGASFLAKCRLVRFLHEAMGFDVLAWESGLFDCREMEMALRSHDVPLEEAISIGIFPIWGASGQVTPVFRYARSTHTSPSSLLKKKGTGSERNAEISLETVRREVPVPLSQQAARPLEMAGFDCQFSSRTTHEIYPEKLFIFFKKIDAELPEGVRDEIGRLVAAIGKGEYKPTPEKRKGIRSAIEAAMARLDRAGAKPGAPLQDAAFYRRTLKNLLVYETMTAESEEAGTNPSMNNVRDAAMADNLLWLANEFYPGKKLIVWAASFHAMREPEAIDTGQANLDYRGLVTMGHAVHAKVGQELYSIAFTAFEGTHGNPFFGTRALAPSEKDSLESLCHDAAHPYLFIDFRALPEEHWLRAPVLARPLGYSPMRAAWPRHFDAMIFTDRMFASSRDGKPGK